MKNTVINTIKSHNLINAGDRVLIALSGGSDSVCLLHILNDIKNDFGFELYACHLNHSIREEADRDTEFVKKLCESLGILCFVKKSDIKKIAKDNKISEELAGRNERYSFFKKVSEEHNINLIATAHNKNDVAETVLMHFIRGSGIDGLRGIDYKRGNIIRPLLDAEKEQIEKYCKDNGYEFVFDKTNNESIYTRNKIRLELIPQICKGFNPSFVKTITNNSKILADDSDYLNCEALKLYNEICVNNKLSVEELKKLHVAMLRRVIIILHKRFIDSELNMQAVHLDSIVKLVREGISGQSVNISNNTKCVLESGYIYFKLNSDKENGFSYELKLNKKTVVPECKIAITLKEWEKGSQKFFLDLKKGVFIRSRKKGDIFYPVGMTGKKKLSDFFTDSKIPLSERDRVPIITNKDDLVWIINKRRDRRFTEGEKAYMFLIEMEDTQ